MISLSVSAKITSAAAAGRSSKATSPRSTSASVRSRSSTSVSKSVSPARDGVIGGPGRVLAAEGEPFQQPPLRLAVDADPAVIEPTQAFLVDLDLVHDLRRDQPGIGDAAAPRGRSNRSGEVLRRRPRDPRGVGSGNGSVRSASVRVRDRQVPRLALKGRDAFAIDLRRADWRRSRPIAGAPGRCPRACPPRTRGGLSPSCARRNS